MLSNLGNYANTYTHNYCKSFNTFFTTVIQRLQKWGVCEKMSRLCIPFVLNIFKCIVINTDLRILCIWLLIGYLFEERDGVFEYNDVFLAILILTAHL